MLTLNVNKRILNVIRKMGLNLWMFFESDPRSNPLWGDTCILYAIVVKNLLKLDKKEFENVLDVGSYRSPLTTIIKELGFNVDGMDILPSPVSYEGLDYIRGDFLSAKFNKIYDIVILCYTIQHIGLGGRFRSHSIDDGDLKAIDQTMHILKQGGILILCVPYGKEKIIAPWHRVYNKNGKLFKKLNNNFVILDEEYYKNNLDNVWVKCTETDARDVNPSEDNYSLGCFILKRTG